MLLNFVPSILYELFWKKLLAALKKVRQDGAAQISNGAFNKDIAEVKLRSLNMWRYCQIDSCQRVTFEE